MALAAGAVRLTPALLAATAPVTLAAVPAEAAETAAPKGESGYTPKLAAYAAALRYEEIPTEVKQRIKDCITDTVAVILYGGKLPWSQMVIAHAKRTGPNGKSHILGTGGVMVQAPSAALAHGAMTHAFELDNLTDPDSGSHPGASMFSSGLAVAHLAAQT
jgi:2-methylcitrate dehydratase PrpD